MYHLSNMNVVNILGLLAIILLSSSPPHVYAKNHQMMNALRPGSSTSSPTDNNKNKYPIIDNIDVLLPEFFPPDMKKEDVEFYLKKTKTLSPISITNVSKNDWLHQCAATFNKYYNLKTDQVLRSEFYFIDEPSGLCSDALSCAFDKCYGSVKGGNSTDSIDCLNNQTDLASTTYNDVASMCNFPPSSLPEYITFPKNAAHVIAAIRYAKQNNIQISIKSTGHSYTGAHTKAGSLMLNMRDYAKYASGSDKIIECNGSGVVDVLGDACILAKARGKDAYIRVGGGQTWSDVHIAVNASNGVGNLSKMYDLGGGGSGSVGAAGGWLSGGGLSTGYERIHGLGIDQILELEVALPDGSHVRVFPIEWNNSEEYINPQTTKVAALCNTIVVANEDKWDWQPCTDLSVSPEDIWLAQRGGGGGTFAVTLSVKYQLFQQYPFQAIFMGLGALAASSDEKSKDLSKQISEKFKENKLWVWEEAKRTYALFLVDLLFAPEKIGVSEEASFSCGQAGMNYQFIGYGVLYCISAESVFPEITAAWERTIKGTQLAKEDTELAHLLSKVVIRVGESIGFGPYSSYADFIGDFLRKVEYPGTYNDIFPDDVIPDAPLPGKSAFVLFYHVHMCVQCEVLVIWLLHLSLHCIHLFALATHMY